jgi:hypothetical protein
MSTQSAVVMRKSFAGPAPWAARRAASEWLSDFCQHPPLHIRSIRVIEDNADFIAVVTYSEMTIEPSPRYFATETPLLKSA